MGTSTLTLTLINLGISYVCNCMKVSFGALTAFFLYLIDFLLVHLKYQ